MTISLNTYTTPRGVRVTTLNIDGTPRVYRKSNSADARRSLWERAVELYEGARSATLRRWDGDASLLHTVAEK